MIVVLPLLWLIVWLVAAGAVAGFSGLAPRGEGLYLFLGIFLGGGFGLPIMGGIGWAMRGLWKRRTE
jgi:hypothetical protein